MAITQSSSVSAASIYAESIAPLIAAYQYDDTMFIGYARYESIEGAPTATKSFPRAVKNSPGYASVATESTALTDQELTMTAVDVTVTRYGMARKFSQTVIEDSLFGAQLTNMVAQDAARLYGELLDSSLAAQFANASTSVGTTNVDLTIAVLIQAMAAQRTNKARGQQVICLDDLQLKQLQLAQAAALTTTWDRFYQPSGDNSQFGGYLLGAPIVASSKCATANAAVDKVGAVFSTQAEFSAFGYVNKRSPTSAFDSVVLEDSLVWASFARFGVGTVAANFATKIISKNA